MFLDMAENIKTLNESGHYPDEYSEYDYSYGDFMMDMTMIESAIYSITNNFANKYNSYAIATLTEASDEKESDINNDKKTMLDKLKKLWESICDMLSKVAQGIYNYAYKYIILQKGWVSVHKKQIINTTLVCTKDKHNAIIKDEYGNDLDDTTVIISSNEINTYENILKPDLTTFYSAEQIKNIARSKSGEGRLMYIIDKNDVIKSYESKLLGYEKDIPISQINGSQSKLISNIDAAYDQICKDRNNILKLSSKRVPPNLNSEELDKFREDSELTIISYKAKNACLIKYIKEVVRILKLFVKDGEKDTKRGDK